MFFVLAVHVELFDAFNGQFFFLELYFICCWREFGCKVSNVTGEGRAEQNNLASFGHRAGDKKTSLGKAKHAPMGSLFYS
jgi:hypothetical protein